MKHDYTCQGVTRQARMCRRIATVHLYLEGVCRWHYCEQHFTGKGVMRMLLPYRWQYDHVERGRQ